MKGWASATAAFLNPLLPKGINEQAKRHLAGCCPAGADSPAYIAQEQRCLVLASQIHAGCHLLRCDTAPQVELHGRRGWGSRSR